MRWAFAVGGVLLLPMATLSGQVSLAHTFTTGDVAQAPELNTNFADLRDAIGPKMYGAKLGTSTGSIPLQNPPGWISNLTEVTSGSEYRVDFNPMVFTNTPACTLSVESPSTRHITIKNNPTATSLTYYVSALSNAGAHIVCVDQ